MFGKQKKIRMTLAVCLAMMAGSTWAQKISGTVKDANGDPVIGATIMEKGTQNGTVTDFDGNFSLNLQKGGALDVSYVGMKPQSLPTSGKSTFNITLEDDATTLNDVVVVGYGTMKRKDLTGSVASVTGESLAKTPVANVAEALQGKLSGVNILAQDGRPGGTMSIRVRGGGSITQSNEPLYVVDGVVVSSIDDIAADNIESIDVLKDAASTAIYGARGANGVILVTTKSAKEGKPQVKYNMYYQVKAKPKLLETQDAYTHVLNNWEYAEALGSTYGESIASYYGLGEYGNRLNDYRNVSSHNYLEDVFETGHMWSHDLSVSGGTAKTKYYASVNFTDDAATYKKSGYSRWNINLKLQQELAKTLTLDVQARYIESKGIRNQYFSGSINNNNILYPWMYKPIDNPFGDGLSSQLYDGGKYASEQFNPNDVIADNDYIRKTQRIRLTSGLTWKAFKGFTAKTELSVNRNWSSVENWSGGLTGSDAGTATAQLTKGDGYGVDWTTTLNYDVQGLGENHSLNFLLGNEVVSDKSNSMMIKGVGYPEGTTKDGAFGKIQNATDRIKSDFTNKIGTPTHTISWFGRANYNLLDRYLFTFTMRADGSSMFKEDNRWGYFPAGAAAWRISEEPFMANTKNWLDNLKLRLSIGTSGNDKITASAFESLWESTKSSTTGAYSYTKGDVMGNPDLKWETTISRNIGLDYSFLNGKFNGAVDFYWNTTKDCLMLVPIDPSTGYTRQFQNVAKTSNKGIEVSFNYNIIQKKDFDLSFGLTYNYNVNKVEETGGANLSVGPMYASTALKPQNCYAIEVGEPVGLIRGYKSAGFYKASDFNIVNGEWVLKDGVGDTKIATYVGAGNYPTPENQVAFPGMPKYQDVNGDGVTDDADETIIARVPAKHTGGFRFNLRYKSFDFAMNFAYQLDGKVFNANVAKSVFSGVSTGQLGMGRVASDFDNHWRMYDIDADGNLALVTDPVALDALNAGAQYGLLGYTASNAIVSDDYIESAAFLRLQTITLGYTFPKTLIKKIGISNARVYFTAGNLFCIKSYSGLDPDVNVAPSMSSSYSGFPTPGYDYNSYPRSRTFTFGLNVAF